MAKSDQKVTVAILNNRVNHLAIRLANLVEIVKKQKSDMEEDMLNEIVGLQDEVESLDEGFTYMADNLVDCIATVQFLTTVMQHEQMFVPETMDAFVAERKTELYAAMFPELADELVEEDEIDPV